MHFFIQNYIIVLNEKVHVLVFISYWIEKCTVKHWNSYCKGNLCGGKLYIWLTGRTSSPLLKPHKSIHSTFPSCSYVSPNKYVYCHHQHHHPHLLHHSSSVDSQIVWLSLTKNFLFTVLPKHSNSTAYIKYEGWNFNSGNYLFTTDTK